ncbi:uncharacterized protein SOCE26_017720 [Sorangium cellulosum]|uniref:Glycine zipper domain-containing protein n=1 Tax=Sorangium cellulosum TaxID=56 RepID=A0A2L0EM82_SORCE|nr:hypothetical protein [Sorangium cellulosum]AUX40372.1 uncharacterized protein SOCE26_017720 [Sorangium cellulosum]
MHNAQLDSVMTNRDERRAEKIDVMPPGVPPKTSTFTKAAAGALAGAAAGAAVGAIAGPPGAVAGSVIGSLVGTVAEVIVARDQRQAAERDAALDEEIGVIGGDLGEASPDQPPTQRGAFSAAAVGGADGWPEPAEGPMQNVEQR